MTEPLRMPPDEFALVKDLAQIVSPDMEWTPEQIAEFRERLDAEMAKGWNPARTLILPPADPEFEGLITIEWRATASAGVMTATPAAR